MHSHHQKNTGWRSRAKIALYVFLGIAAFFLITEHLAHLIPILPWLFLLLCPHPLHSRRWSNYGNMLLDC